MKKLFLFFALINVGYGQSTTFYSFNIQASPVDAPVAVNTTLDGAVALSNYLFKSSISQANLTANCNSNAITCTFSSVAGVLVGSGVCFAQPCNLVATATGGTPPTTYSLSSGEVALVTAISGNTLTLKRSSIGTATNQTSGQGVTFLVAGSFSQFIVNLIVNGMFPIIANCANGAYTTVTNCTAIATANSALNEVH